MSKIVLEDFNEGDGYYKVNLAYLNKEQVEEIEALVSKWKPTDEDIKSCIGLCLTDANEQRFKDYGTNLKDCLAWLEKQSQVEDSDISQHDNKTCKENDDSLTCEDERIRKAIIDTLKDYHHFGSTNGVLKENMIAWLEKQGEKPTIPKWKYKKDHTPLLRDSLILNKYGCVAKSPSGAIVSDVWVIDYDELAKLPKEELEKQDEKPQVDGFDAELNALLKKYEHLPKEEILGCLNFYVLVLGKEMEQQ